NTRIVDPSINTQVPSVNTDLSVNRNQGSVRSSTSRHSPPPHIDGREIPLYFFEREENTEGTYTHIKNKDYEYTRLSTKSTINHYRRYTTI
ncbi:hypothetical protein ABE527_20010, partial [Brucella sp. TWI432]